MHPLKQMQKLLTKPKVQQGTLLRQSGDQLFVSTEKGIKVVKRQANDGTNYRDGDQIRFEGEIAIGRRRSASRIYVM
jgi:hypothetical protein